MALATASCVSGAPERRLEGRTMGTTYHVCVLSRAGVDGLQPRIDARLDEINRTFSEARFAARAAAPTAGPGGSASAGPAPTRRPTT